MGTPQAFISSLAYAFEPSIRAAAFVGPKAAMPAAASSSTSPATSGASGPTTTRSTSRSRASATRSSAAQALDPVARDPGVAGRRQQLGPARAARQRARERVLAPARAHNQYSGQRAEMKSSTGIAESVS